MIKLDRRAGKPCHLCTPVFDSMVLAANDLPRDRAIGKALKEFRELHDNSDCIEYRTCMPILRATTFRPTRKK